MTISKTLASSIVLGLVCAGAVATAQTAPDDKKDGVKQTFVLAMVDGARLSQAAKAMKAAQEEAQKLAKRFEADFTSQEGKLKQEYEQLQKDRAKITGEEYDRRLQRLNQRAVENRRTAQIRQQQMTLAVRQVQLKFREEVVSVVKAIAVEEGYTIVLDKAAALHSAPQYDITEKVLSRLDQSTAAVKFEFPPKAEPGVAPPPDNDAAPPAAEAPAAEGPRRPAVDPRKPPTAPAVPPKKTN